MQAEGILGADHARAGLRALGGLREELDAALERAAEITPRVVEHLRTCRDTLVPALAQLPIDHLINRASALQAPQAISGHWRQPVFRHGSFCGTVRSWQQ